MARLKTFKPMMENTERLTTEFRKLRSLVPAHFEYLNQLIIKHLFFMAQHQLVVILARKGMVKASETRTLS